MNAKSLIFPGMILGSFAGSLVPMLWGGDMFSLSSIIFAALGGILGIWLGFRFSR